MALGIAVAALPAVAAAQSEPPMPAACAQGGMLLKQPRIGSLPGDSAGEANARRLLAFQEMTSMARAQAAAGSHMRVSVVRGWLGISTSEMSEKWLGPDGRYVRYCDYPVVVSVDPDSPAQRAGLEAGDTIVAYNGRDLRESKEFALDRLLVPADTLRVSVRRDGRELVMPLVVGRSPEVAIGRILMPSAAGNYQFIVVGPNASTVGMAPPPPETPGAAAAGTRLRLATRRPRERTESGLGEAPMALTPLVLGFGTGGPTAIGGAQVMAMDEDLRSVVGARSGVLVLKVADGTPASEAGLRSGDVIVSAGGLAVTTPAVIQRALVRSEDGRAVPLRVERRGKVREVMLRW